MASATQMVPAAKSSAVAWLLIFRAFEWPSHLASTDDAIDDAFLGDDTFSDLAVDELIELLSEEERIEVGGFFP